MTKIIKIVESVQLFHCFSCSQMYRFELHCYLIWKKITIIFLREMSAKISGGHSSESTVPEPPVLANSQAPSQAY